MQITETLTETPLNGKNASLSPEEPMKNQLSNPQDRSLPLGIVKTLNAKNKAELAEILSQVCALQKAYGKSPAELETLVEGFSWALADYSMPKIIKALREYVLTHSDIPAPADIISILNRETLHKTEDYQTAQRYKKQLTMITKYQNISDIDRIKLWSIGWTDERAQWLQDYEQKHGEVLMDAA